MKVKERSSLFTRIGLGMNMIGRAFPDSEKNEKKEENSMLGYLAILTKDDKEKVLWLRYVNSVFRPCASI